MHISRALEGYKISLLAAGYSPLTITPYISVLNTLIEYLGDKEIQSITSTDLHAFMSYLVTDYNPERRNNPSNTTKLSTASHHRYWKAIRSFFKWAEQELSISRPDISLKMPAWESREIMPFTEEEIRLLIKSCDFANVTTGNRKTYQIRRKNSFRNKSIILMLLDTGIRVGELTRLRIRDVNLENGEVYIHPFHVRKSHSRTTFLGKAARKVIWHYLVSREGIQPDEMLFVTSANRPMTCQSVLKMLSRLGNSAGVMNVHPHRFRHTFAVQYLRNGGDIFTLKRLLGHKRFDMVNHYLNLSSMDTQNAHQKASPVDRWNL
jgi:integrase/recombinase XerD